MHMITRECFCYNELIINTLNKISKFNKRRKVFICEVFTLFLSIKGRINFLQLSRFGSFGEQRYRQQFEKPFPFLDFNAELVRSHGSGRYCIAFDPSYISKSGKKTSGLDWYWSGCAGHVKRGLEIGGIAAIDIDNHTAFHLEAVQTLCNEGQTLTEWYIELLKTRMNLLKTLSSYFVADAWFSKEPFVRAIIEMGMHFIGRLRDDADLRYICVQPPSGKRGRPRKYDGKVDVKNLNMKVFQLIEESPECTICSGIVYSKSLKRNIRLTHVVYKAENGRTNTKLYFSTDINLEPKDILELYRSRFQIEFLYRDAKQHTGLTHVQARSAEKLDFHFNTSLSVLNLAKITHWLSIPKEERKQFSMNDIKTMNHNKLMMNRFFDVFGINPNKAKNRSRVRELLSFGIMAA